MGRFHCCQHLPLPSLPVEVGLAQPTQYVPFPFDLCLLYPLGLLVYLAPVTPALDMVVHLPPATLALDMVVHLPPATLALDIVMHLPSATVALGLLVYLPLAFSKTTARVSH